MDKCPWSRPDTDRLLTLPREAAQAWKQYIEPLKTEFPDITLVSPAITSDVEGKGKAWLAEFFRLCPAHECRVDGINIHWYGGAHELDAFISFVNSCYAQFQRPVWVTEFAIYEDSPASMVEKQAFIRNAVSFLESNPDVAGYAVSFLYTKERILVLVSPPYLAQMLMKTMAILVLLGAFYHEAEGGIDNRV